MQVFHPMIARAQGRSVAALVPGWGGPPTQPGGAPVSAREFGPVSSRLGSVFQAADILVFNNEI